MRMRKCVGEMLKKYKRPFEYMGDCRSTVDVEEIWNATQMAQVIEDEEEVFPFDVSFLLSEDCIRGIMTDDGKVLKDEVLKMGKKRFSCEIHVYQRIAWIYDEQEDIHYFFCKD